MAVTLLGIALELEGRPSPAEADHSDGNMPASVNYWLVGGGQLRVCNNGTRITTNQLNSGLAYWNNGLNFQLAVNSCTNFGVEVIDVNLGDCGYYDDGRPVPACTVYAGSDSPEVLAAQDRSEPGIGMQQSQRRLLCVRHRSRTRPRSWLQS